MQFNQSDPFPLLNLDQFSYAQAQEHAEAADAWLGLKTAEVEAHLESEGCLEKARHSCGERQELWIGLATKSLLTPYLEIRNALAHLNPQPGQTIADLGAAYGRMAFVIGRHFPLVYFVGYEFVGERVAEGQRCLARLGYNRVRLVHEDLARKDFSPALADFYFIYDYGTPRAIEKTLHDLKRIALEKPIVVVGRGRLVRDHIERLHPWLSQVVRPEHLGHFSIYRSALKETCS